MKKPIVFCNKTDVGRKREKNEDYYGYFETPHGDLFIVADGMGGHAAGEVASAMAVNIISDYAKKYKGNDFKQMLEEAIQIANKKIYQKSLEDPRLKGMGTTVVILFIHKNKAIVANVGDSRCYLFRKNKIVWVSKDQTKVQYLVDRGIITPQEAEKHPERHILLQALGSKNPLSVDFAEFTLYPKDRILLCTDGLYEYIKNKELENFISGDIDKLCDRFINIANERGGGDNITVQIIEYIGKREKTKKLLLTAGSIVGTIIILSLGFIISNQLWRHYWSPLITQTKSTETQISVQTKKTEEKKKTPSKKEKKSERKTQKKKIKKEEPAEFLIETPKESIIKIEPGVIESLPKISKQKEEVISDTEKIKREEPYPENIVIDTKRIEAYQTPKGIEVSIPVKMIGIKKKDTLRISLKLRGIPRSPEKDTTVIIKEKTTPIIRLYLPFPPLQRIGRKPDSIEIKINKKTYIKPIIKK